MSAITILKIESTDQPSVLHIELLATTRISFDLRFKPLHLDEAISDVCHLVPCLVRGDFEDAQAIRRFNKKYEGFITGLQPPRSVLP